MIRNVSGGAHSADVPGDLDAPVGKSLAVDDGRRAVRADIEQLARRQEAGIEERRKGCLYIARVLPNMTGSQRRRDEVERAGDEPCRFCVRASVTGHEPSSARALILTQS